MISREEVKFDPQSMDAKVWAKEFVKKFNKLEWMVDEPLMIGWFANAIMAGYDEARRRYEKAEQETMGEDRGNISDGYHTFNELYDHRCLLWINLCNMTQDTAYLVKEHFEGWFLLGNKTPYGQVSYHCPNKYLPLVKDIKEHKVEYDGHTSSDVISRLEQLAKALCNGSGRTEAHENIPMLCPNCGCQFVTSKDTDRETRYREAIQSYIDNYDTRCADYSMEKEWVDRFFKPSQKARRSR